MSGDLMVAAVRGVLEVLPADALPAWRRWAVGWLAGGGGDPPWCADERGVRREVYVAAECAALAVSAEEPVATWYARQALALVEVIR